MKKYLICIILIFKLIVPIIAQGTLRVGTKHSNESYILGELVAQILEDGGFKIERKFNLGGTAISFEALKNGSIDVYPEYSGTIAAEILKQKETDLDSLNKKLKNQFQLEISAPFGFNNTYALALPPALTKQYPVKTISELAAHPEWRAGLSYEFLKRADGWGNLSKTYQLPLKATGLEHGIAYQALLNREIEVTDAYSTDGEIAKYGFTILEDDLHFFPKYEALALYRSALPEKAKNLLKSWIMP